MVFCLGREDLSLEGKPEALLVTMGEVSFGGSMVKGSEAGASATVFSDPEEEQ